MNSDIFTNYKDWLTEQTMPKGRRSVILSGIDLFSQQGFDGTSTAQLPVMLMSVKPLFLNISKPNKIY